MTALENALMALLHTDATLAVSLPGAVHLVTVTATGGTFTLTFNAATTTAIAEAATAATVQAALVALASVGASNVTVTGSAGGPFTVTFTGTLANTALPLTGSGASLTPGGSTLAIAQRAAVYNTVAVSPPVSYLVFTKIVATPEYAFNVLASEEHRYQITVVTQGASRATIETAMDRVDALLNLQALAVSGKDSWGIVKISGGPSEVEEVGGTVWQWGSNDYRITLGN